MDFWPSCSRIMEMPEKTGLLPDLLLLLLSLQSCLTLCDPTDGSPPGSPVPGILQARTLEWVPFPSPRHEGEKWKWSCSGVSDSWRPHGLQPTRLLCPWDFPGKSTGVGCHRLLRDLLLLVVKCGNCSQNPPNLGTLWEWIQTAPKDRWIAHSGVSKPVLPVATYVLPVWSAAWSTQDQHLDPLISLRVSFPFFFPCTFSLCGWLLMVSLWALAPKTV